jgi:hypothetical protein
MLPSCYPHAALMLPSCCCHAALMLPSCCPHATHMLPSCCPHAALMLPSCCPHAAIILPSYCHHATPMLLSCCPHTALVLTPCCPHGCRWRLEVQKALPGDHCCQCPAFKSSKEMREFFCCPRAIECQDCSPEEKCCKQSCYRYYDPACTSRQCEKCRGQLEKLTCEKCRAAVPRVKHQKWTDGIYKCKDGREKKTWDFESHESNIEDWLEDLGSFLPDFLPHHNRAKFLDDDWQKMFHNVSANGTRSDRIALVIDYANSYSHEHRDEHYQEFWNQLSTTILGCVMKISVANLTNAYIESQGYTRERLLCLLEVDLTIPSLTRALLTLALHPNVTLP